MPVRGVLLYSGGLDSLLAARLLIDQGIGLLGVMFVLPFFSPDYNPEEGLAARYAGGIGLPLEFIRCGMEYMEIAKNPPHGYGKRMNPCIDCKIFFLKNAGQIMERERASFVATGEVVGQRPMSQMRHMLNHIEKQSGLQGKLLRPLSAKLLKPTLAEQRGEVDRERLLGISGRSRAQQLALAEGYGIRDYSSPAGGCLFTDAHIAPRVRDLYDYVGNFSMPDVYLLNVGRHLRLNPRLKIIVGRNEPENRELWKYRAMADLFFEPQFKGPSVFARGVIADEDIDAIASIMLRYGRAGESDRIVQVYRGDSPPRSHTCGEPMEMSAVEALRI